MVGDDAEADGGAVDGDGGDGPAADASGEDAAVALEEPEAGAEDDPGDDQPDEDAERSYGYDASELTPAVERANPEDWDLDGRHPVRVGNYTWVDYLDEYGPEGAAESVHERRESARRDQAEREAEEAAGRFGSAEVEPPYPDWGELDATPPEPDWGELAADPTEDLGFKPEARDTVLGEAHRRASNFHDFFDEFCDPETTPVVKDEWLWEHYKRLYYYEDDWTRPRDENGDIVRFDPAEHLGFDPDAIEHWLSVKDDAAKGMLDLEDERTVNVHGGVDEDAFFSTVEGDTTMANRYDLEKAVSMEKKRHFREVERYWVNKPLAFVVIFHSERENEKKYYLVEPYRNPIEEDLREFLTGKLRTAIKYASDDVAADEADERRTVIERETRKLLDRYNLYDDPDEVEQSLVDQLLATVGLGNAAGGSGDAEGAGADDDGPHLDGIMARPEPAVLAEDSDSLTEYQVETLLYVLKRNFVGYERIDGVKHDINVEDISCDGYNSPVFVYHTDYENLITNVHHGEESLDDFVVSLAQQSGKGISKRQPQVDATLPDGSRAQLTLGREVSDHGTNYTIRQFKDVPFTPVDLINWQTFSLDEMAFLWLCIESNKSIVFAGGTASGKTTSLNAVSLFIPSNTKIVSIEDTREVELPQRNWIASVTRPSFGEDETGDIDEFDLLEAALRQRPDYIVMGEVRGEEGRTLFQVMSTGHTTYTTFHADNVGEVLKRFTTEPINVSKTLFTALDLVSIQTQTRVRGQKVRRNRSVTEINRYDPENDEINVNDVFQWEPEDDNYRQTADSSTLDEIRFDRGWTHAELDRELQERRVLLAYLIEEGLNEYAQVAATAQAYINDPDTILTLVANDDLEAALEDLRGMESVLIDVDPEKEELVPRPDPSEQVLEEAQGIVGEAREEGGVLHEFEGETPDSLAAALTPDAAEAEDVVATPAEFDPGELESAVERVADTEEGFGAFEPATTEEDEEPDAGSGEAADGGTAGGAFDDATGSGPRDEGTDSGPRDAGTDDGSRDEGTDSGPGHDGEDGTK